MTVNHLDGDKSHNGADNLEWTTPAENMRHAVLSGLTTQGERNAAAKLKDHEVKEIREMWSHGWPQRWLADMYGVTPATLHHIVHRLYWKHVA